MLQHIDSVLTYGGLVGLASASVYAGSLGSYKAPKPLKVKLQVGEDDSDDDEEELSERLGSSEALLFPILGSIMLGGLYLAFKYLGEEWINKLLGYYFCVMGTGCVWSCLLSITKSVLGSARYKTMPQYRIKFGSNNKPLLKFRLPSLVLIPISAIPSLSFFLSDPKSAIMTDILALSFSHTALGTMKIDSLQTGCILLSGLFLYDIWWVFGTKVMVTVATSLTIPIKLLWPRSILTSLSILPPPEKGSSTMLLGLGDVAVPGLLVALAYRLDMHLRRKGMMKASDGETYFRATMIGYMTGLSMAFAAMHVFKAAQPALLYLSPTCCLSFIFTALKRNEWKYVWAWEDGAEEEKERKEWLEKQKQKENNTMALSKNDDQAGSALSIALIANSDSETVTNMTSLDVDMNTIISSSALVGLATLSVYSGSVGSYNPPAELECLPTSVDENSIPEQTPLRNGVSLRARHVFVGVAIVALSFPIYLLVGPTLSNLTRSILGTDCYRRIPRIRLVLVESRIYLDFERRSTRPNPPAISTLQGVRLTTVFYLLASLATSISYMFGSSKSIYISDVLMFSLAHVDMSLVKPGRLRTACIFLVLVPMLFGCHFGISRPAFSLGYGTLAVSEIPNLNNPSQLLIPTTLNSLSTQPTRIIVLSALDIILPGKFVAFAYRLDAHLRHQGKQGPLTYFGATLVGYTLALSIALGVTHILGVAQLASLYINPMCFLSFVGTALLRGEWRYIWAWKEGPQEDLGEAEVEKNGVGMKEGGLVMQ
ncbi:Presenilin, signal peptide peptidase, family, partial [Rhizoctonia solani]